MLARPRSDRRRTLRLLLLVGATAASGCDGSRAPSVAASAAAPSSGPSAASSLDARGPAPGLAGSGSPAASTPLPATSASASAAPLPNDLPPDLRQAWAELVGRDLPDRFAGPEERRYYARCLAFTRALHEEATELGRRGELDGTEEGDPTGPMRAIAAVRAHPPPDAPAEDVVFCADYTLGGLRLELATRRAAEARRTLQALGGAMVAAHARTGKLCPSSERPVPEKVLDVVGRPYQPKPADWDGPSWRCLRFRWLVPMRFQVEVRANPASFSLIARGSPAEDGQVDEYRLDGRLGPAGVELGEVQGRYLLDE